MVSVVAAARCRSGRVLLRALSVAGALRRQAAAPPSALPIVPCYGLRSAFLVVVARDRSRWTAVALAVADPVPCHR